MKNIEDLIASFEESEKRRRNCKVVRAYRRSQVNSCKTKKYNKAIDKLFDKKN